MTLHGVRFPGESDEYRAARDRLLEAEVALRRQIESVAAQRRELPPGGAAPTDHVFEEWDGAPREVRLSELFAPGRDTLLLYSFMWVPRSQGLPFVGPCPSCTSMFTRREGRIHHFWSSELFFVARQEPTQGPRHVDFMWPIWPILDRAREGRSTDWEPSLEYRENSAAS